MLNPAMASSDSPNKRPIQALLFDKDGTLIDFDLTWGRASYAVMRTMAQGDPARLAALVAINHYDVAQQRIRETSPLLAGSSALYGPLWAEALDRPAGPALYGEMDRLFAQEGLANLTALPDVEATLRQWAGAGYRLGIATNDNERSARLQLDALGWSDLFSFIAGYDSGFGSKPDPGMVTAFADATGLEANQIAMIGDSHLDLFAAKAAGTLAVCVLTGPSGSALRETLAPHADLVIDALGDLDQFLMDAHPARPISPHGKGNA